MQTRTLINDLILLGFCDFLLCEATPKKISMVIYLTIFFLKFYEENLLKEVIELDIDFWNVFECVEGMLEALLVWKIRWKHDWTIRKHYSPFFDEYLEYVVSLLLLELIHR